MSRSKIAELADIAVGQWGMITTAQAAASGISPQTVARLANGGELERLAHGIYRLAGTPPNPHDYLRAAWLALEPRLTASERIATDTAEVVSHRSAAVLHELGDVDADVLEFTAGGRRQTRRSEVRFHRGTVDASSRTLADGLPVTTPLRTIGDLAAARLDRGHLAGVVRDALIEHNMPVAAVAAVLDQHARAYGVTAGAGTVLVDLMLDEAGVPQSTLDVATHLGGNARRMLAEHLLASGTLTELARSNVDALVASGILEAIARMNVDVLRSSGILEAIQTADRPAFARLIKEIKIPDSETLAALLLSVDDPAVGRGGRRVRGQSRQMEAPSAAGSKSLPARRQE